jgi:nucleoside-diphosphate-sugar epimerase
MIMITGGFGFIGANLAKYFLDQGERVLLTGHRNLQVPSFLQNKNGKRFRIQPCDVLDLDSLIRAIQEHKVKTIVHGATIYLPTENYHRVFQVNVGGTMNVMEAAMSMGVQRVTIISSRAVYIGSIFTDPVPEIEEISIHASNYIQVTKKANEILLLYYRRNLGMDVRLLRVARVYGPLSGSAINPVRQMVESVVNNIPVEIHHSPEERNDFVYVKDCARGIGMIHLAPHPQHYIYNVGAGQIPLLSDFASVIKKIIPEAQINFAHSPGHSDDLRLEAPIDIKRISKEFDYVPEYDIEKGMIDYIRWLRDGIY